MTKTFNSLISKLEEEIESQRTLLQNYLASDMDIDEMDYNEVVSYAISDVNDQNIFIGHWKDYAFLRGKLETAKQLKEFVEKAIEDLKTRNVEDKGLDVVTRDCWIHEKELRKALGVEK